MFLRALSPDKNMLHVRTTAAHPTATATLRALLAVLAQQRDLTTQRSWRSCSNLT